MKPHNPANTSNSTITHAHSPQSPPRIPPRRSPRHSRTSRHSLHNLSPNLQQIIPQLNSTRQLPYQQMCEIAYPLLLRTRPSNQYRLHQRAHYARNCTTKDVSIQGMPGPVTTSQEKASKRFSPTRILDRFLWLQQYSILHLDVEIIGGRAENPTLLHSCCEHTLDQPELAPIFVHLEPFIKKANKPFWLSFAVNRCTYCWKCAFKRAEECCYWCFYNICPVVSCRQYYR